MIIAVDSMINLCIIYLKNNILTISFKPLHAQPG